MSPCSYVLKTYSRFVFPSMCCQSPVNPDCELYANTFVILALSLCESLGNPDDLMICFLPKQTEGMQYMVHTLPVLEDTMQLCCAAYKSHY